LLRNREGNGLVLIGEVKKETETISAGEKGILLAKNGNEALPPLIGK